MFVPGHDIKWGLVVGPRQKVLKASDTKHASDSIVLLLKNVLLLLVFNLSFKAPHLPSPSIE